MKKLINSGGNANANARMLQLRASAEIASSNYMGTLSDNSDIIRASNNHSNMAGNMVSNQKRLKPIIIDITNSDSKSLMAPIFSKSEGFKIPFDGIADALGAIAASGKGITITPKNYTVDELKELSTQPFTIERLRYRFGDSDQLDKDWTIRQKIGSSLKTEPYQPSIAQGLENQISDKLEDKEFFMEVNSGTTLLVGVAPAINSSTPRTLQVILFIGVQTDLSQALRGQSVITTSDVH